MKHHLLNIKTSMREAISISDCFYFNAQRSWRRNATWSTLYNLCLSRLRSLHDNQTFAKRKESTVQQNTIYSLRTLSLPTILWRMQLHTSALSSRFIGSNYSSIRDEKQKTSYIPIWISVLGVSFSLVNTLVNWRRERFISNPNQTSVLGTKAIV